MNQNDLDAVTEEILARNRMVTILQATSNPYEVHDAVETYRSAILSSTADRMGIHALHGNTEYAHGSRDTVDALITFVRTIGRKRRFHP